ncbi:GNAT family N-acetyltransferase [Nocardioides sp.]|uniref:GNAT family N-acetyltransferase n=1 Tax=Nocardioides sp. TaxID=35761 RepID=UPI002ED0E38B
MVPDQLEIRPRRDTDVPALVEVLAAQQPTSSYPMRWPLPFPIEQFVVRRGELATWTALADGRPVGHVAVQEATDELFLPHWEWGHGLPGERLGVMSTLFVDPDVRGAGLGRRLHDVAVEWLRAHGRGPCLDVAPVHAGALRLYEAVGWVEVCRLRPPWLPAHQPDVRGMVLT